jgi:cellulose biosynthesis protein BcsQ
MGPVVTGSLVVSANMKGGVGKTSVAVALAEATAFFGRTAVVVDLDLQINASVTLNTGPEGAEPWHLKKSIADYFDLRREGQSPQPLAFVQEVAPRTYLMSGKLTLLHLERQMLTQARGTPGAAIDLNAWMDEVLQKLRATYDLVIVDCPPGMSLLSEHVINRADVVVLPQAPDRLSTQGLEVFARYLTRDVGLTGVGQKTAVLINMVPSPMTIVAGNAIQGIEQQARHSDFPYEVFQTKFSNSTHYKRAMGTSRPANFDAIWTGVSNAEVLAATRELWSRFLRRPIGGA